MVKKKDNITMQLNGTLLMNIEALERVLEIEGNLEVEGYNAKSDFLNILNKVSYMTDADADSMAKDKMVTVYGEVKKIFHVFSYTMDMVEFLEKNMLMLEKYNYLGYDVASLFYKKMKFFFTNRKIRQIDEDFIWNDWIEIINKGNFDYECFAYRLFRIMFTLYYAKMYVYASIVAKFMASQLMMEVTY